LESRGASNIYLESALMLVDEILPVYDVSDSVATLVDADLPTTWQALMDVDLIEVGRKHPLVSLLGSLRVLPDMIARLLHGEAPQPPPARMRLRDLTAVPLNDGGWVLLGERPEDEIALGLVGKFWRPVIEFTAVSADEFVRFDRPGFARTVYSLSVRQVTAQQTLLVGTMRTATTDEHARRWFRRYWSAGIGAGAHILVDALLAVTREIAETSHTTSAAGAAGR
jgi:hypothetical protein